MHIDVDEEELDEGDLITCEECGAELKVLGLNPLELESADEEEEEDAADPEEADDGEHWP
jgi:alpha-aminoadipate carrier protein LysW